MAVRAVIADVIDLLVCPVCAAPLELNDRSVRCPAGHSFDVARQGYLNLLRTAPPAHADTAAMVGVRDELLSSGAYQPLADAVARRTVAATTVVEAGAGTGYYLHRALAGDARGLALDISAYACRRAARLPRIGAVVADTWQRLPVRDGCADALLNIFAPRNLAEFHRLLAPGGLLLVVTPLPGHLAELRQAYGLLDVQSAKQQRLAQAASAYFEHVETDIITYPLQCSAERVRQLVQMGPNAFHGDAHAYAPADTRVQVQLDVFRRPD